jgi:WD40 repeat protein
MAPIHRQLSALIYVAIIYLGSCLSLPLEVSADTTNKTLKKIEQKLKTISDTPGLEHAIQKFVQKKTEWYEALDTDVIHMFDLSGKELTQIKAAFYSVSPDGNLIISKTSKQNSFQLFSTTGKKIAQIQGDSPDFSPNSKCFTALSGENVDLYNSSGQKLAQIQGSLGTFSPDGQWLTTYQEKQSQTTITNCITGQKSATIAGLQPKFSSDGKYVVSMVKNADRGQTSFLYTFLGQKVAEFPGEFVDFSLDGKRLATFRSLGNLALLDSSGKMLAQLQGIPSLPGGFTEKLTLFSPDGKRVITKGLDFGTSYLYDANSGKEIAQLEGVFSGTSSDGTRIATATLASTLATGTTQLYDQSGQKISILKGSFAGFSPNSRNLATYTYALKEISEVPIPVTFHVFDVLGKELATVPGVYDPLRKDGEKSPTFSSDGQRIVTFTNTGQVFLFDLSGKAIAKFTGIFEGFSKDGKRLLIRSGDTFQLFDTFGNKIFQTEGVYSQFSPDAQRLLIVSRH